MTFNRSKSLILILLGLSPATKEREVSILKKESLWGAGNDRCEAELPV